jgi:hypothetical protein
MSWQQYVTGNKRGRRVLVLSTVFSAVERNVKIDGCLHCYQAARFKQILVTFDNIRDHSDVSSPMGDSCHVLPVRDVSEVLIYSLKCGCTNLVFINFVTCTHEIRTMYLCEREALEVSKQNDRVIFMEL